MGVEKYTSAIGALSTRAGRGKPSRLRVFQNAEKIWEIYISISKLKLSKMLKSSGKEDFVRYDRARKP